MSRVFFRKELENVASFWRIFRRDGIALAFTTHDRDLWFDGLLHRAAPGMLPSAIRRSADLSDDGADISGALSHDTIASEDLALGRFDQARIVVGAVDWDNLDRLILYVGEIGAVTKDAVQFSAQLRSAKAALDVDPIPRSSPSCRAKFCDDMCTLSARKFTHETTIQSVDFDYNSVGITGVTLDDYRFGELRWIDGPQTGITMAIRSVQSGAFVLDRQLDPATAIGLRVQLREGCDHRLETCATRFNNAINFQGEPFLPGNDLLAQYPVAK